MTARRAGVWILLPQAVSRLASIYVFAMVASRADAGHLGALALGTAFASASLALAPAVVGKPLAATQEVSERWERAPQAQSAAVVGSVLVAALLLLAAVPTAGLTRLALLAGALGIPAVMVVETMFWRSLFLLGARRAGLSLSAAYVVQAGVVTAATVWLPLDLVILSAPAGLLLPAAWVLSTTRDLSLSGARSWVSSRPVWLPYVAGVAASVALVQAIPIVLTLTAGFASASTYRAGELAFGGTNLLIGVVTQTLMTQGSSPNARRVYARLSGLLACVAVANGIAIAIAPSWLLEGLLGPTAPLLQDALPWVTAQRAALAVSSVGAILLLARVSARRVGVLDVVAAVTSFLLLVVGATVWGLEGGLGGLTVAEFVMAMVFARQLRRAT